MEELEAAGSLALPAVLSCHPMSTVLYAVSFEQVIASGMREVLSAFSEEPTCSPTAFGAAVIVASLSIDRVPHLTINDEGTISVYDCIANPQRVFATIVDENDVPVVTYFMPDGSTVEESMAKTNRTLHANLVRQAIGVP